MQPWAWYALLAGGAAAAIGIAYAATQSAASSATVPSTPVQPTSGGGSSYITLNPSLETQTFSFQAQTPVVVALPSGNQWVSIDGVKPTSSTTAYTFVLSQTTSNNVSHTFVWSDATGTQYTSTLYFTVTTNTPQTTSA
jgi:hypothetical protein